MRSAESGNIETLKLANHRALAWDRFANAICALMILASLAFAAFRLGLIVPPSRGMNIDRAMFSAINTITLTGFEQNYASFRMATESGLIILMMLTIASASVIGGTASSLALQLVGVRSSMWILWLGHAVIYLIVAVLGGSVRGAFDNVGAITLSGIVSRDPIPSDSTIALFWFLPLVVIGSTGLIGIASLRRIWVPQVGTPTCDETTELDQLETRRDHSTVPVSPQVRVRTCGTRQSIIQNWIGLVALIYLVCLAINFLVMPSIASSNAWAINARVGLPIDSFRDLSASAQWLVMIQSLIGAMPGSTSGGLSILPIALTLAGLTRGVAGKSISRIESISIVWIGAMILSIIVLTLILLRVHVPMSIDQAVFLSISSISNSGLSPDPLNLTGSALIVLGVAEFFARILSLGMLAWMAASAVGQACRS